MTDAADAAGPVRPPDGPPPGRTARRGLVRLAAPAGALAGVVAAVAFVGAVDPNEPGHYPACPLLRLTGIYCPGCGGLRTAHAVAHGEFATALSANALVVFAFLACTAVWLRWAWSALRRQPVPPLPLRAVHWWVLGGLVLVFSVVRNLPPGAALAP